MSASSSCVSFPSGPYVVDGPASLGRSAPTSFVTRSASKLYDNGQEFRAVGANIYWLGLDENINSTISYPTQGRILEIMATAAAMGASVLRSQTIGISVGQGLSVWPTLGQTNEAALRVIDFAVAAARAWGIRLVVPLTDNYDYYHGGKFTFLRWRNLTDEAAFYTDANVIADFKEYIGVIVNRTNSYTNISYSADPTILAWETGNELNNPPSSWTSDITSYLKGLAPNQLTVDGAYGIQQDSLSIDTVDIVSNHYYPMVQGKLSANAKQAASAGKAFFAGEYDWTTKYTGYAYFACLIPLVFVIVAFCLPNRWFPWTFYLPRRFSRKSSKNQADTPLQDKLMPSTATFGDDVGKSPLHTPRLPDSRSSLEVPLTNLDNTQESPRRRIVIRKWMFALSFLILCPIAALIAWRVGPTSLATFLSSVDSSPATGDAYWSLFGRDDNCCQWVQHDDGFTLHYREDDHIKQSLALTQHAYAMTGAQAVFSLKSTSDLPVIACPQQNITF